MRSQAYIQSVHKSKSPLDGEVCGDTLWRERCEALEVALRDYVIEAHIHSIDGLDECDHDSDVCFCGYHQALRNALIVLGDQTLTRIVQTNRGPNRPALFNDPA